MRYVNSQKIQFCILSNSDIHSARPFYMLTTYQYFTEEGWHVKWFGYTLIAIYEKVFGNLHTRYLQARKTVVFFSVYHLYHNRISTNFQWNKFHGSPKIHRIHKIYGPWKQVDILISKNQALQIVCLKHCV